MQEKQDQKVVLISFSIHINLEHEVHTQKLELPLQDITLLVSVPIFTVLLPINHHHRDNQNQIHHLIPHKIKPKNLKPFHKAKLTRNSKIRECCTGIFSS